MDCDTSWTEGPGPRTALAKQPASCCCEPCAEVVGGGSAPTPDAQPPRRDRLTWKAWLAPLNSVAIIVFPKCPICGATYLSLSGAAAMPLLPPLYWIFPVLVLLLLGHLAMLGVLAWRRGRQAAFGIACAGTAALLLGGVAAGHGVALGVGAAFVVLGSVLGIVKASRLEAWRRQVGRLAAAIHRKPTRS